ncbi:hypothetical protein EB796_006393 [Bugula neritina]|uniref:Uncharacterized protein n=1 Tax=Bugula neritina TaxID=10212 RepID=A0A7J7K9I0_BUGNE|nr:hypothetical protein EB796_006393 [Bugula neritina]
MLQKMWKLCILMALIGVVLPDPILDITPNPRYYRPTTTQRPHHPVYKPHPKDGQHPHYQSAHTIIDDCTCFEKGNYYSPVTSNNCHTFTQYTSELPPEVLACPYGLQFDVKTCVCNNPRHAVCPYQCPIH